MIIDLLQSHIGILALVSIVLTLSTKYKNFGVKVILLGGLIYLAYNSFVIESEFTQSHFFRDLIILAVASWIVQISDNLFVKVVGALALTIGIHSQFENHVIRR